MADPVAFPLPSGIRFDDAFATDPTRDPTLVQLEDYLRWQGVAHHIDTASSAEPLLVCEGNDRAVVTVTKGRLGTNYLQLNAQTIATSTTGALRFTVEQSLGVEATDLDGDVYVCCKPGESSSINYTFILKAIASTILLVGGIALIVLGSLGLAGVPALGIAGAAAKSSLGIGLGSTVGAACLGHGLFFQPKVTPEHYDPLTAELDEADDENVQEL